MMGERLLTGFSVGVLLGLPWLALSYAANQTAKILLLPFEVFELFTRLLPGELITTGIESMIQILRSLQLGPTASMGKIAEFSMAYLLALLLLTVFAVLYALTLDRVHITWFYRGLIAAGLLWYLSMGLAFWSGWGKAGPLITAIWLAILNSAWGIALAWGVERVFFTLQGGSELNRRQAIAQLTAGSLVLSGIAIGLGRWLSSPTEEQPIEVAVETPGVPTPTSQPSPTPPPTQEGFVPVPGTRDELTPIADFYRVDINLLPPDKSDFERETDNLTERLRAQGGGLDLPSDSYVLRVDGLVETPLTLNLTDLKSFPPVNQYATLECISNPVGGDLISTTQFTGARLKDVLERAGLLAEAVDIRFTGVDGYTESLPLEAALDQRTLLCYNMGNKPLTQSHGSPLRLYTPNRFGMKNPKWIIKIEAVNEDYQGYWEQRGWSEQAWVQTTAVIDTIQTNGAGQTEIGGIAFAGERGINEVEVRVDNGEWVSSELNRALSPLTWVLWRATLEIPAGSHQVSVRATDGDGEIQTAQESDTHPDGATGYHMKTAEVGS